MINDRLPVWITGHRVAGNTLWLRRKPRGQNIAARQFAVACGVHGAIQNDAARRR
jgi:hypothetical protein